jgi:hypothetical protein
MDVEIILKGRSSMSDKNIYQILESLDAAQRSVKQLPALFKPRDTSPQLSGPYPGRNATQGYLVGEDDEQGWGSETGDSGADETPDGVSPDTQSFLDEEQEPNPMAQAVTRRIVNQHPELLMKYGPREVMQAIDDVTEGDNDWEEIGSSDVSAYVNYVKDYLRDYHGSREEMDDRQPFAEQDVEEGEGPRFTGLPQRDTNQPPIKNIGTLPPAPGRPGFTGKPAAGQLGVKESLRDGEYHLVTVTLDDGSKKQVRIGSDEGFREPIVKHFEKQGRKVTDIDVDWSVRSDMYEGKDTATEDVLSAMKKKLGDYLQDVATAIKKDPDLLDKLPDSVDQIRAVKTIKTDDGHEIKILGNEDDGFRISIKNNKSNSKFSNLDEAVMAVEMFCARRRSAAESADYIEEKQ